MMLNSPKLSKQKGMTLIEVLIASMILFMALGLSASVFRQSALLQEKVIRQVETHRIQSSAMPLVKFALENNQALGTLTVLGKEIEWRVVDKKSSRYVNYFDFEQGEMNYGQGNVSVVTIELTSSDLPSWNTTYDEVIWQA